MSRNDTAAADKPAKQTDEEIVIEIRENCTYMLQRWGDIREQGDLNMKCLSVEGLFPDALIADRNKKENPRVLDHTDIISFANNRVVNQWRMNPRGVQVNQTGSGATKDTAETREQRLREIAYSSQAKSARLCAFQNMVDRGYGAWEIYLDYESPRTSRQKICIGRIPNPNSVLIDPDTSKADRSDAKYAAKAGRKMKTEVFQRKYKNAKEISSFPVEMLGLAKQFISGDGKFVTPMEYWRVVAEEHELLTLANGQEVFERELDKGYKVDGDYVYTPDGLSVEIVSRRKSELPKVEHYVTNGLEILDRDIWKGSTIPLLFGVAREKYVDDELTVEALTSKARVPQLHFDLVRSREVETINMTPLSKWVVSDEQIAGYEPIWENAHRNPTAFLMVHERGQDGQPIAHPERTDYEPPIQGLEAAANSFLRDAQNTLGMATVEKINRESESGVAQQMTNESQDIGTFHLTDNMIIMVEYEGRICNELLSIVEDSNRTVGLREASGKYKTRNLEVTEDANGKVQHPYGPGDSHGVTISTGPDYQSQHQEKVKFLENVVKTPDFLANPLAPMIIHEAEIGPGGDKMERVALAVQPPAVQAAYAEDDEEGGKPPMSPEAIQTIEKLKAELEAINAHAKQLETQVIELEDDVKASKVKADSDERISADDNASAIEKTNADNATKLEIERMKADLAIQLKQMEIQLKSIELEREKIRGEYQMNMQSRDQSHESAESSRDRDSAAQLAREAAKRKEIGEIG